MYPQTEQVFDDGNHRLTCIILFSFQDALYLSISMKVDQEASEMCFASLWFLTIPFTFKSSNTIISYLLIKSVDTLCKLSFRELVIFLYILATFNFCLL